jgi:predicted MFS family arabinose efflux permease
LFFFDGLWVVAATTSVALFALVANLFDGVAVASDVVGRATYIRRYALPEHVASIMGFQNALINFGTVVGACISIILIRFASYPWIFLGIVPANAIALLLLSYFLPKDGVLHKDTKDKYWSVWKDVIGWPKGLRSLAGLTLLFYALTALATILISIYAYIHGANLQEVILLGIIVVLPQLLASPRGKLADAWRDQLFRVGLIIIALLIGSLAFVTSYLLLLPIILLAEIVLVLLGLVVETLVTAASDPAQYGRVSAVFEGLKDVGKFIGAVGLGFAFDLFGSRQTFLILAVAVISFVVLTTKPRFRHEDPRVGAAS